MFVCVKVSSKLLTSSTLLCERCARARVEKGDRTSTRRARRRREKQTTVIRKGGFSFFTATFVQSRPLKKGCFLMSAEFLMRSEGLFWSS